MSGNDEESRSLEKRRTFLSWFLGIGVVAWTAGILVATVKFLTPPIKKEKFDSMLSLGSVSDILNNKKYKKKSDSLIFKFQGKPSMILRTDSGKFRAFNAVCTHLGCIVTFKKDKQIFFCNCHGGIFSADGKNIAGPPPSPLEEFAVIEQDGKIFVAKRST